MMAPERIIAVDWSGSARPSGQRKHIWTADSFQERICLFHEKTRDEICSWLIEQIALGTKRTVVGFDFAFSLPKSFFRFDSYQNVGELWQDAAANGEFWLSSCEAPFWGRPGKKRPATAVQDGFRRTDRSISVNGISPMSPFKIGGAGAVGTGSIRGLPILNRLREAGFAIWPFDKPKFPIVVEIYPRVLTGPVKKSQKSARIEYLRNPEFMELTGDIRKLAEDSEDAFDALVSVIVMRKHGRDFAELMQAKDPIEALEGRIWDPDGRNKN